MMSNERTYNVQLTLYELLILERLLQNEISILRRESLNRFDAHGRISACPPAEAQLARKFKAAQDEVACKHTSTSAEFMGGPEYLVSCNDCGQVVDG